MNEITVRCAVREYPDNEEKGYQTIYVDNHWNSPDKVVLEVEGKRYVVIAKHLKKAIDNACNAHR